MMPGFGRTGFGRYNLPRFTPLVNVYITMDNHHVSWVNQLCLWPCSIAFCMFTGGYNPIRSPLNHHKIPLNPIKPPFSYGKSPFFRRGGSYCFPTTVTSTVQPSLRRSSHLDLLGLLRCAGSLLRSVPARPAVPWEQICRFLDLQILHLKMVTPVKLFQSIESIFNVYHTLAFPCLSETKALLPSLISR